MFSFPALLLACCVGAVWGAGPPKLDVGPEVVIKTETQDSFQLRCEGSQSISWNWTSSLPKDVPEIVTDEQENNNYPFVSTFTVNEPIPEDIGFYRCHYADATNMLDSDKVASTYIYIHDENIMIRNGFFAVEVFTNKKLVLDCRTTLPDAAIKLTKDGEEVTSSFLWDPKIGFVRGNLAVHDSGFYKCTYEPTGEFQGFHVEVRPASEVLPQPSIDRGPNPHFVMGHPFSLNCTIINGNDEIALHWSYPNSDIMYQVSEVREDKYTVSTLLVPKASTKDSGTYTCTASASQSHPTSASMDIKVQEELKSYVNISSTDKILVNQSEELVWRAEVLSFPHNPRIVYTNWRNEVLKESERIELEFQPTTVSSWLKITNVTSDDFGNYTLTAFTTDGKANASVTVSIEIKSAPSVEVIGVPAYLPPGRKLDVSCLAQGFPVPSIAWDFQSCPNGKTSCSTYEDFVAGETSLQYPAPGNLVKSNTLLKASSSGYLRCVANNSIDTINHTVSVLLSEIGGLHVLRHTGLNDTTEVATTATITVITNDDFLLLCGANKLHYKAVMLRTPPNSGIKVHENESDFSFLREVATTKATKALAGKHSCRAERNDGKMEIKNVTINVLEEAEVKFQKDANMAKNETVTVKENEPYFLNCTVAGRPIPTVTWQLNDKPLHPDSPFFDGETAILSNDEQRLELKYVFKKKHVGVYTCTAKNRVNTMTGRLTLNVPAAGFSTTAKVGLAVTLAGIALLIITVAVLFRRVKRERKFKKSFRKNALYLFERGNIGQLNPDCSADEQAELLPYGQEWEVPRENITLGKQLGSGAFGRVVKASVTGLEGPAATTVAIKMCKSQADPSQVHALTLELKIMIHLGKHLNIVNLMGAKTVDIGRGELWILVEYCRFGNLLVFMHRHRRNFINQIDPVTGRIDPSKMTLDNASLLSPLSPGASSWRQTCSRGSQDRFSASPNSPIALSQPPLGHHAASGRQHVDNPLYNATMLSPTGAVSFFGPNNTANTLNSDMGESCDSDGKTLDTTTETSSDGRVQNTYYTSTLGSTASQAPLSPTESGLVDSHGNSFVHEVGSVPGVNAPFTTTDLVCWAWQVAHGMEYLASRKVLHGDLAARNLLLADDNVVKISDFGLSREMYKKDVYMKKGDDLMPIKWISVEAIRDRIFSVQSDVWAFGVTLWEIFSLGSTPYPGIEVNKDFLQLLEDGYRMSCPKYANQEIYNLLLECWDAEPRNRPSFRQAFYSLDTMMQADIKGEYLNMNDQYMRMNEERFKEQTDYLNMLTPPDYENMTNKANDDDLKPHYVNMEVAGGSRRGTEGQASIQSPETVSYCNMGSFKPSPALPTNHYLPMNSTRGSRSPENDVFSPRPSEPTRFTFPQDEEKASSVGVPNKDDGAERKDRVSETEHSALIINGEHNT